VNKSSEIQAVGRGVLEPVFQLPIATGKIPTERPLFLILFWRGKKELEKNNI